MSRALAKQAHIRQPNAVRLSGGHWPNLWRLPNTRHAGTGLYKVPLTLHELLHCSADEIKQLALQPRSCYFTDQTGLLPTHPVRPGPDAVDIYQRCRTGDSTIQPNTSNKHMALEHRGKVEPGLSPAERAIYEQGVPEGSRVQGISRLAARMRAAGYAQPHTEATPIAFNRRNRPPLPDQKIHQIVSATYQQDEDCLGGSPPRYSHPE